MPLLIHRCLRSANQAFKGSLGLLTLPPKSIKIQACAEVTRLQEHDHDCLKDENTWQGYSMS